MRTTLALDDTLLDALKQRAHAERRTVSELVEEAARLYLAADAACEPFELVTYGRGGLLPGVTLDSYSAQLAAEDAARYTRR